jgi:hypothetical protein
MVYGRYIKLVHRIAGILGLTVIVWDLVNLASDAFSESVV